MPYYLRCPMIIYNVTVNVDDSIHYEWLEWMKTEHIKKVVATGHFNSYRLCKVLSAEDTGFTYAIQYFCLSMEEYKRYEATHAPRLRQEAIDKFQDKALSFRTLLDVLE